MVGKSDVGDLFPRSSAPNSTPRIKKRNGQILFGPETKRPRQPRSAELPPPSDAPIVQHGVALRLSRISPGMTVLGLVTKATRDVVEFVLPSGIRATCIDETLLEDSGAPQGPNLAFSSSLKNARYPSPGFNVMDNLSSDDDHMSEAESDIDANDVKIYSVWQLISVGQVLPLAVISVEKNLAGRSNISVSLKPHLINANLNPSHLLKQKFPVCAAVRSVEDHGYVLSFGSNIPYTAFLPFELCSDAAHKRDQFKVGSPVEVVTVSDAHNALNVRKVTITTVLRVSARSSDVLRAKIEVLESATFQDLRAGMTLRARVIREGPGGLLLLFMGVFSIYVDAIHVPRNPDGTCAVSVDSQVAVRVLYVDAASKVVGGSLLPELVDLRRPRLIPLNWKIGFLLKEVVVEAVQPGYGVLLRYNRHFKAGKPLDEFSGPRSSDDGPLNDEPFGDKSETLPLFAHISKISDFSKSSNLEEKFPIGMVLKDGARIISISRLDGSANVDLRPKVLSRKALSIDEVEPGCVYDCKILNHLPSGSISVAVDGDPYLGGIVPFNHISDVLTSKDKIAGHDSLRIGSTLKCLALSVNVDRGRIFLSARKSLTNSRYPILTSLEEVAAQLKTCGADSSNSLVFTGSVLRATEKCNLLIGFCNKIVGFVPQTELCLDNRTSAKKKEEIETIYPPSQTIITRVTNVNLHEQKLYLSLDLKNSKQSRRDEFQLGHVVDVKVVGVDVDSNHFVVATTKHASSPEKLLDTQKGLEGRLDTSAHPVESVECHLPFGQLSDSSAMSDRLAMEIRQRFKRSRKNSQVENLILSSAMVLCYRDDTPVLTLKESLKLASHANRFPASFSDLQNMAKEHCEKSVVLRGYIKGLLPSGAIVGFSGDTVGFVRTSRIADFFISDHSRVLKIDQSVSATIEDIDDVQERFTLSLRQSDVGIDVISENAKIFFGSLLRWGRTLQTLALHKGIVVGSVIKGTVDSVLAYGVQYKIRLLSGTTTGVVLDIVDNLQDVIDRDVPNRLERLQATPKKSSSSTDVGAVHEVRVLDIDPISGVVDLSKDDRIIKSGRKASSLSTGNVYEGRILLVKAAYVIVAAKISKDRTVIAVSPLPTLRDTIVISPGVLVTCRALQFDSESARHLVLVDWEAFKGKISAKNSKPNDRVETKLSDKTIAFLRRCALSDESSAIGTVVRGRVTRKFPHYIYLALGEGVVGHLHISKTCYSSPDEVKSLPLGSVDEKTQSRYSLPDVGTIVTSGFVAGIRRTPNPDEHSPLIVEVSLEKRMCLPVEIAVGQRFIGFVKSISPLLSSAPNSSSTCQSKVRTLVAITPTVVVSCPDVDCLTASKISLHSVVVCMITQVDLNHGLPHACLSDNGIDDAGFFLGLVDSVASGLGIRVSIPWLARDKNAKTVSWGTVDICEISVDFEEADRLMGSLKAGDTVRVRHLRVPDKRNVEERSLVILSMRDESEGVVDPSITPENAYNLKKGSNVRGFIRAISDKGGFISIGRDVVAHVKLCDLSDEFVESPKADFPVGKLVCGSVIDVQKISGTLKIGLTLRKRLRAGLNEKNITDCGLKEGHILQGTVRHVKRYGALVEVKPGVTGLLHTSEADQDRYIQRPLEEWVIGQKLNCVVIKREKATIGLGTKRCYFEAAGIDEEAVDEMLEQNERWKCACAGTGPNTNEKVITSIMSDDESSDAGDIEGDQTSEVESRIDFKCCASNDAANGDCNAEIGKEDSEYVECLEAIPSPGIEPLEIPSFFDFGGSVEPQDGQDKDSSESEHDQSKGSGHDKTGKKVTSRDKREKKRVKDAKEIEIRLREEALAHGDDLAETAEDYERLLMGEPNSSALWIRYMAFCIELSQVEKARAVAERALSTITLENETDRTNIWVAYINMEAQFGRNHVDTTEGKTDSTNVKDSVDERAQILREAAVLRVFGRACERVTDVENLHLTVAAALQSCDHHLAVEILKRALRKFKSSEKVWVAMGNLHFSEGDIAAGRQCLERALLSMPKQKHVDVICKFAQFEYKMGSAERGRTIFESLVGNLKKRTDIWNVYLDMEVGLCKKTSENAEAVSQARQVFTRFAALDLNAKKTKFAFKKWMDFEKIYGGKSDQKRVKQLAREYVERSVADQ